VQKKRNYGLANNGKAATRLGQALIIGRFGQVGKTKGSILRGLLGRAPFFYNGSAATPRGRRQHSTHSTHRERFDLISVAWGRSAGESLH
jgi:hypothetical protein